MKKFVSVFFILISSSSVFAENYRIVIRAKGSGEPLKRAELKCGSLVKYSDKDGVIELSENLSCPLVSIYRSGFIQQEIAPDKIASPYEFFLIPDQPQDNVVLIKGEKKTEPSAKVISIEEAKAVAPRGDPAQIVKLLPGVQSSGFRPDVAIRGSAPDDSVYYVDALEVPFMFHSIGGLSVIPKEALKDIKFSAGGFDASVGEATGGVIRLKTPKDPLEKDLGSFTVNVPLYSAAYYTKKISDTESLSIGARRSYVDFFLKKILEGEDTFVVPVFYDIFGQWIFKKENRVGKITFINSSDGLKLASPTDSFSDEEGKLKFDLNTKFWTLGSEVTDDLSDSFQGWKITYQPQYIATTVKTQIATNFILIDGSTVRLPIELTKKISDKENFSIGLEIKNEQAAVHILAPVLDRSDPLADPEDAPLAETKVNYRGLSQALWASQNFAINNWLLTSSLRLFSNTAIDKADADPRLSATYQVTQDDKLEMAIGRYTKSPTPEQTDKEFGNPDLDFSHTNHYILGWERDWSEKWNSEVQLYYKDGYSQIVSDKETRYSNKGELLSLGLELFLRRQLTDRAFGWLSYTLSQTESRKNSLAKWYPVSYDQTHVVNLVGSYNFTGQWSLGGRLNYHTGDRYTPLDYAVYNANYDKYQQRIRDEDLNKKHLPDYYQIDLYTNYDFLFNLWKMKLKAGVEYLSLKRPVFGVTYNYDYSKERYFQGVPPIPYLEIQGEF